MVRNNFRPCIDNRNDFNSILFLSTSMGNSRKVTELLACCLGIFKRRHILVCDYDWLIVLNKSRQHDLLLQQINEVQQLLKKSEAELAARLEVIRKLEERLQESESDSEARLKLIHELEAKLKESEADRIAQLKVIQELKDNFDESEKDRAARLDLINDLTKKLQALQSKLKKNNITKQID